MRDLKPITRDDTEHGVEYVKLADANAEISEWSERACNVQHQLNVALSERDQARFDLAASVKATQEHGETIMADRAVMREVMDALQDGRDALQDQAEEFHRTMRGYKPARHEAMDESVRRADAAISKLKARAG